MPHCVNHKLIPEACVKTKVFLVRIIQAHSSLDRNKLRSRACLCKGIRNCPNIFQVQSERLFVPSIPSALQALAIIWHGNIASILEENLNWLFRF